VHDLQNKLNYTPRERGMSTLIESNSLVGKIYKALERIDDFGLNFAKIKGFPVEF
jgi:hypothetical protein